MYSSFNIIFIYLWKVIFIIHMQVDLFSANLIAVLNLSYVFLDHLNMCPLN